MGGVMSGGAMGGVMSGERAPSLLVCVLVGAVCV